MKTEDIAWAAGLFEGEGCIYMLRNSYKGKKREYPRLQLEMTDLDVIERFAAILGVGTIHKKSRKNNPYKPSFVWSLAYRDQIEEVMRLFWPYLGNRRKDQAIYMEVDPID